MLEQIDFLINLPKESWHALAVDVHSVITLENGRSFTAAKARIDHGDFVQEAFDPDVFWVFGQGLIAY
jgi:hypothetical protein